MTGERETFGTRFGMLMTMIGVAVGLGNVWRFPYMTGRYGGATFVLIYVAAGLLIGVPALMAEWALGRETRRGAAGAYERVGFPLGKPTGWFLFGTVVVAMGYYTNARVGCCTTRWPSWAGGSARASTRPPFCRRIPASTPGRSRYS